MKLNPNVTPYMFSNDERLNASLSLAKIYKRITTHDRKYRIKSRFQARLMNRLALHRHRLGTTRP